MNMENVKINKGKVFYSPSFFINFLINLNLEHFCFRKDQYSEKWSETVQYEPKYYAQSLYK